MEPTGNDELAELDVHLALAEVLRALPARSTHPRDVHVGQPLAVRVSEQLQHLGRSQVHEVLEGLVEDLHRYGIEPTERERRLLHECARRMRTEIHLPPPGASAAAGPFVFAPAGLETGTSRRAALRPATAFRLAVLVPTGFFVVRTALDLHASLVDGAPWRIAVTNLVVALVLLAGSLRLWTTRVWVEHSLEEGSTNLHQYALQVESLGRRRTGILRSPHVLRVRAPQPHGARPSWRVRVTHADGRRDATISAPWITDLHRLLEVLRPAADGDPRLLADDETRQLVTGTRARPPAC